MCYELDLTGLQCRRARASRILSAWAWGEREGGGGMLIQTANPQPTAQEDQRYGIEQGLVICLAVCQRDMSSLI